MGFSGSAEVVGDGGRVWDAAVVGAGPDGVPDGFVAWVGEFWALEEFEEVWGEFGRDKDRAEECFFCLWRGQCRVVLDGGLLGAWVALRAVGWGCQVFGWFISCVAVLAPRRLRCWVIPRLPRGHREAAPVREWPSV